MDKPEPEEAAQEFAAEVVNVQVGIVEAEHSLALRLQYLPHGASSGERPELTPLLLVHLALAETLLAEIDRCVKELRAERASDSSTRRLQ